MDSKKPPLRPATKRFLELLEKNLKQQYLDEEVRKIRRQALRKKLSQDLDQRKN